ncbi:MAG: bifunctional 4-hydroxy-2-oxoglutarate aldolase/2-dehydro-3-deoxy-phosphogluconate aldolase [Bacillota bacterium]
MDFSEGILKTIYDIGIVPIVSIDDSRDALSLGDALAKGRIPIIEVTLRTAAAIDAIRILCEKRPEMCVGAGTVLTMDQAKDAIQAGAQFVVTPGFNPRITAFCMEHGIPIIPGCITPTEISNALDMGIHVMKFFPADSAGGTLTLNSMFGPFPTVRFMPTSISGIHLDSINEYLVLPNVIACGSTWIAPPELINKGGFDEISHKAHEAVLRILGFELGHVGINMPDAQSAKTVSAFISSLFGFPENEGEGSIFCDKHFEILKQSASDSFGHVALRTNFVHRAVSYFESQGVLMDWDTADYSGDGKLKTIYFKEPIGGINMHLLQKQLP